MKSSKSRQIGRRQSKNFRAFDRWHCRCRLDDFGSSPVLKCSKFQKAKCEKPKGLLKKSPDEIVKERAKDDSQGLFGFLKTVNKEWTVRYDENASNGKFSLMDDEEIASGAARDQSQNWLANDARCGEGVIPVECRSAACGTCWVGVLGGAEKLSDVSAARKKTDENLRLQSGRSGKTDNASGVSGESITATQRLSFRHGTAYSAKRFTATSKMSNSNRRRLPPRSFVKRLRRRPTITKSILWIIPNRIKLQDFRR